MTNLKINNIIKDVRSYRGVSAQSNHFLIKAKVKKFNYHENRQKIENRRKNWYRYHKILKTLNQYKNELRNKLKGKIEAENLETFWKKLDNIIKNNRIGTSRKK